MRYLFTILITVLIVICFTSSSVFAQRQKLAQTGMKFLSVSMDARATAMGEAVTALNTSSAAMFYNPSSMAELSSDINVSFGTTRWIADINYLDGTVAFKPFGGDYGVFGVSMVYVDYGEFIETIFAPNQQGYLDVGNYKPSAMALGVGYAKSLSQKFSVGGNIRYVRQSLGSSVTDVKGGNLITETNSVNALSFDFGVLYHTGFKSLDFGMCIRNFSTEVKYKEENFQLPLTFKMGLAFNAADLLPVDRSMHSFLISVDASHPRDYSEQIFIGGEYTFMNAFSIRAGYNYPKDEGGFNTGFGVMQTIAGVTMGLDYAYSSFGVFNSTNDFFGGFEGIHRLTVKFAY